MKLILPLQVSSKPGKPRKSTVCGQPYEKPGKLSGFRKQMKISWKTR